MSGIGKLSIRLIQALILLMLLGVIILFTPWGRYEVVLLRAMLEGCPGCPRLQASWMSAVDLRRQDVLRERTDQTVKVLPASSAGYRLFDTVMGRFWVPARPGDRVGLVNDLAEQQRKIYGENENGVRVGDVVLDCGANVGVFTREALFRGAKLVVAIEPVPENVECLRRNFSEEISAKRVVVYPKGVWDKDDLLPIHSHSYSSVADSSVLNEGNSDQEVKLPMTTIDHVVDELKLERVDFIKMDIEGAEQRALAGARRTLQAYHPRLSLSVYHLADDPLRIPLLVRQAWPQYQTICGPVAGGSRPIRPGVLYFR
mgnify:CR=1 FL=1